MQIPKIISIAAISLAATISGITGYAEMQETSEVVSAELAGRPLQQVAITTGDLSAATVFYRDRLGLPLLFESNGMAFFDMAGIRLMVAFDAERPAVRPTSILYFDVDDFQDAVDRLIAVDVELDGSIETVQSTTSGDLKIQQFKDLDGNALALIGLVPH